MLSQTYSFVTAGLISPEQMLPFVHNISIYYTNTSEIPSASPLPTNSNNIKLVCGLRPGYQNVMNIINIIDTLMTLICPVIVIVVMNTMIARNLFLFRQSFLRQGNFEDRPHEHSGTESYTLHLISAEKLMNSIGTPQVILIFEYIRNCESNLFLYLFTTILQKTYLKYMQQSNNNNIYNKNQLFKYLQYINCTTFTNIFADFGQK